MSFNKKNNLKKKYSGKFIDIYSWKEKMYDGKVGYFETAVTADGVQILAIKDNKICIPYETQPSMNNWVHGCFGGRIDNGETPLQAAKRELKEESGFVSNDWKLFKVFNKDGKIKWNCHFYIAKNCIKKYDQSLDNGEKIKVIECNWNEFLKYVTDFKFRFHYLSQYILKLHYDKKLTEFKNKLFSKPL
ncbi:NUDIX hydrolase [Candidatus Woesearchaeota archaeon]|jgi:ADP-ribose pyrophosphatase|nr:NUDIX hydrolase [Candidatus Woesearchaeota archaeon]MBT4387077.1 NUDIX hydrolase [Candidatus Woesearchaeota archaeon]MBT4596166.1 NUDIX hydrolase [Candidatus Woesearchaeota archaeon]MBT5741611.1 NUDIX hydrolase [Candidatus Woesearchaeota archaeon]MBT6505432.1 NUDIX hydrolase [Candidatus Woesearchaeota archaeon]